MNDDWQKTFKPMSNETQIQINNIKEQVERHEQNLVIIQKDLAEVKLNVGILVSKFQNFTPNCPVHQLSMENIKSEIKAVSERQDKAEQKMEGINTVIIRWTAIATLIAWLISQFGAPLVTSAFQSKMDNQPKIELFHK